MGESFVHLADGTELPVENTSSPLDIIIGHGLGSDPSQKSHTNDISSALWKDAQEYLLNANENSRRSQSGTAVLYTARGHSRSRGWEQNEVSDDNVNDVPFRWPALSEDMVEVANECLGDTSQFTILGQSMGAASALYLSIDHPDRVNALILARPPRAWERRAEIASVFVAEANELQLNEPGSRRFLPLLGAAHTDLPPRSDKDIYRRIQCPVLILSHGEDVAHPLETGQYLSELLPKTRLELAANEDEARLEWPKIIGDWLADENLI
eukprot:CAMPEP_0197716028 /NCGR_PEP_ID=MMETSP1434-20131217/1072_1 /TAXON_ID=265543 /ORGANISM="Minutocellus polymorphus, Strain CCMP3303" /LENGTH=267 /DNA_ID=CAMNT_0043300331 /DNA_START=288 /DNA_END=1091 /DNA_ORIENTATION=+